MCLVNVTNLVVVSVVFLEQTTKKVGKFSDGSEVTWTVHLLFDHMVDNNIYPVNFNPFQMKGCDESELKFTVQE
jgi:hypothetical protein